MASYRIENFGWCLAAKEHGSGEVIVRLETGGSPAAPADPTPEQLAELDRMVSAQRARWSALTAEA